MTATGRLVLAVAIGSAAATAHAGAPTAVTPAQLDFFESKIRPLLVTKCQKCHGDEKHKGGLRLDSRLSLLKGGETGPAVVPGKPDDSLLVDAVNYRGLEMPPTGRLKEREIKDLAEWVRIGAPWPAAVTARKTNEPSPGSAELATGRPSPASAREADRRRGEFVVTDEDRRYWAFQPIGEPRPPHVKDTSWVATPVDAFILAGLEQKGLQPNAPADARTLIRRAFFDLVGLPPTPEEVAAFIADPSASAYEKLIDGLLARKEYGERWGRHWLDVARFAQTNGYERDAEKLEAWRYRDYVINAFNDDKPYDRFIIEQLAGDELEDGTLDSIVATGFCRLGIWDDEPDDKKTAAFDEVDELVRTTGSAFLGLTLGCARCHNHMFDPIAQEDYYRFAAFFANVEPFGTPKGPNHLMENEDGIFTPLVSGNETTAWNARRTELQREIDAVRARIKAFESAARSPLKAEGPAKGGKKNKTAFTTAQRDAKKRLTDELHQLEEQLRRPPFPRALSVRECGSPLRETRLLIRGNAATPGKKVDPQLPAVLGGSSPLHPLAEGQKFSSSTTSGSPLRKLLREQGVKPTLGLRRELAAWIAGRDNPLTARVMMNRLWQHHFGRGIVRSSDNFGRVGTPPTHPELLAWLARDFMEGQWRIKRMHKRIMLSNAYRMSSATSNPKARAADADNDLFWRQNMCRLDAEAIRDAVLAVSGRLNPQRGGRGIFPKLSQEVLETQSKPGFGWGRSSAADESRRSVYIYLKRTLMVPFLETFDYTDTAESLGRRPTTTVAPQALLLLNSDFAFEQAGALAERVRREAGDDRKRQVDRLFGLALGRGPTDQEKQVADRLIGQKPDKLASNDAHPAIDADLQSLCLVVLNLNEFVYVD